MSAHEPDNQVLRELPPYAAGRRECPECGSDAVRRCEIDSTIVIPYLPMACDRCAHIWTPRPSRWLALLYLPFGLLLMATAPYALVFSVMTIWEWWGADAPFSLVRTGVVCLMGGIALPIGGMGLACFRAGLHYCRC